jgi:hypothetical protein
VRLPIENAEVEREHEQDEEEKSSPDPDHRVDRSPPVIEPSLVGAAEMIATPGLAETPLAPQSRDLLATYPAVCPRTRLSCE